MLIVKNLDKSFDGNEIFKNLNFSVQDGEKVAVVGLNGAGKSTLFRILLNQIVRKETCRRSSSASPLLEGHRPFILYDRTNIFFRKFFTKKTHDIKL